MFISSLILAISSSIDSLGIGITYGLKNTKISFISKIILFTLSLIISFSSIFLGYFLNDFISTPITSFFGSLILIFIGICIIFKTIFENKNKKNNYYDFNFSNLIDPKEAIVLGLALSLDSFGIGISYSLIDANCFLFPILISSFQILFLSLGSLVGRKLKSISKFPDFIYGFISGILLILIGLLKI